MPTPDAAWPLSALRLVPHYDGAALERPGATQMLVARLLEDGTGEELRWLFATQGESAIATWLGERGARALSRRSRALWYLLLDVSDPPAPGRELWPLA